MLSFNRSKQLYEFDTTTKQFSGQTKINQYLSRKESNGENFRFFIDQSKNIIIEIPAVGEGDAFGDKEYILIDNAGQLYNYNEPIYKVINSSRHHTDIVYDIYGKDFRTQACISLRGELVFTEIQQKNGVQQFFEGRPVRGISQTGDDEFLVVFDGHDASILNAKNGKSKSYHDFENCYLGDPPLSYAQYISDNSGKVWFPNGDKLIQFSGSEENCNVFNVGIEFLKFNFINERKVLLVEDKTSAVYTFDLDKEFIEPFPSTENPLKLDVFVNECYASSDGLIWIATDQGLWKIDYVSKEFRKIGLKDGFSDGRILCVNEDKSGNLWLGTFTGGIHIYDPSTESVTIIDNNKGLSNNTT